MRFFAIGLALLAGTAATAQSVEVASGDWSDIPRIEGEADQYISKSSIDRVHRIVAQGDCELPGQSKTWIDLNIPFLLQFDAEGKPQRIVISRMNCPELESVVGGVVLQLAKGGEYKSTGENPAGWYRSELSFALR